MHTTSICSSNHTKKCSRKETFSETAKCILGLKRRSNVKWAELDYFTHLGIHFGNLSFCLIMFAWRNYVTLFLKKIDILLDHKNLTKSCIFLCGWKIYRTSLLSKLRMLFACLWANNITANVLHWCLKGRSFVWPSLDQS